MGYERYYYVYSFWRNPDTSFILYYGFLTFPPLYLHSLTSLISNCLSMPFGTQGRSGLHGAYFLQTRNEDLGKGIETSCTQEGPLGLAQFQFYYKF